MTELLHSVGLVWNKDFHSGNMCFSEPSQNWKMVDLEEFVQQDPQTVRYSLEKKDVNIFDLMICI